MGYRNKKYDIIYAVMLLFCGAIILWAVVRYNGTSIKDDFFGETGRYDSGWHTAEGDDVNLNRLAKVQGTKKGEEYSIYNTIPDSVREGDALCFRSKNIFYKVYIDGKLAYSPYIAKGKVYTRSYGTDWNYVQIPSSAAGKQVEVRVRYVYGNAHASIDHICIGSPGHAILDTFGDKLVAFVTCVLLLFVGLLLIVADIPINMSFQKNHELRYLGLFSAAVAVWCLSETNLIQFYLGDSQLMQVISCSALMLIPIPIVLYLDSAFGFKNKLWVPLVCFASAVQFTLCWGLHFLGAADIHETLPLTHIMLVVSASLLLFTIVRDYFVSHKKNRHNVYHILRTIGLCGISVATAIDILRYYYGGGTDSAMFVRIGILVFTVCFGSSSLEQTINAVKLGVQSEFVAQLAYRDGLTLIGNRTSFEEHLLDLEKVKDDLQAVGIVMFDVNDLKYVNDHMGHHYGDDMLVKSAEIIRTAFEPVNAECFRIGGDEFAVLLGGDDVEKRYEESVARFMEGVKEYNKQPDKEFRISIAHGFALYNGQRRGTALMDIYQEADMEMYTNKKAIKEKQIPPDEYYRMQSA